MFVTAAVFQLDRSPLKALAWANIPNMFVTADVSQLGRSLLKTIALLNMSFMFVTAAVSQLDMSSLKSRQAVVSNKADMSVTNEVFQELTWPYCAIIAVRLTPSEEHHSPTFTLIDVLSSGGGVELGDELGLALEETLGDELGEPLSQKEAKKQK
jgi:hypothetical protein